VGILDSFEKGLERAVNGAFAKTFRSGLQPVEITSALRRELDTKAAVVSRERILAPNRFFVRMAHPDFVRMSALGSTLIDELTDLVQAYATEQRYQFAGGLFISISEDASLTEGLVQIDSSTTKGGDGRPSSDPVSAPAAAPRASTTARTPVVEIAGKQHTLVKARTVIGRGSDADITVDDTGTSRAHVEILWDGAHAQVRDLGSTNGSQLNGSPLSQAPLEDGSIVIIGRTRILFRLVQQRTTGAPPQAERPHNSSDRHDMGGFWGPSA
jgi:pSer/pThr/pTyr-binding forkhead associated (FHA) protein